MRTLHELPSCLLDTHKQCLEPVARFSFTFSRSFILVSMPSCLTSAAVFLQWMNVVGHAALAFRTAPVKSRSDVLAGPPPYPPGGKMHHADREVCIPRALVR